MDAIQWSTGVHATAMAIARCASSPEELTRTALFFTQLGTTLAAMAAIQGLDAADAAAAQADLTDLG